MNELYKITGLSKQALWKYNKRQQQLSLIATEVVDKIKAKRKNHKRMGCRKIYYTCSASLPVGRDLFEQIGFANGFKLKVKRNKMKTTWSQRIEVYPNLIEGMKLNNINQVWQSDIFYLKVGSTYYYGVSIEDVYSRKLLVLHVSKNLRAEQNVKALKKALKIRSANNLAGCIFHSDRGSQYISEAQKSLLKGAGMRISMGKMPQENAYVERIQGILKHEYLFEHNITEANLQKMCQKITKWYNDERPHNSLKMMTPTAFEQYVEKLDEKERPITNIYQGFAELSTRIQVSNKKKKVAKKKNSPRS